jgi:sorbitol-specific phosphotransferase system component IIBC
MQEAAEARRHADDLDTEASTLERTGSLERAQELKSACMEMRVHAATTDSVVAELRMQAEQSKHSVEASKMQATAAQENLALLERTISTIQAAMDAASQSEELTQQATEDLQASGAAKEQVKLLAEQLQYALKEAQDAEAQAESLANEGQMEASMNMLASAARCRLHDFKMKLCC